MGFLEILNGVQNGPREKTQAGKGGMSPLTMAILRRPPSRTLERSESISLRLDVT